MMASDMKERIATTRDNGRDADTEKSIEIRRSAERGIEYTPIGERASIKLTPGMVKRYLCVTTKSGKEPTEQDITKFMMLCRARQLNPWVGDAFLVGYDTKDGPQFSLITSYQALAKRADLNPNYDGIESGIVVVNKGEAIDRVGSMTLPGDRVIGAWANVYRKDRDKPFAARINLKSYDKGYGLWRSMPENMIEKCAKAAAQREAFPTELSGLYTDNEMTLRESDGAQETEPATNLGELTEKLKTQIPVDDGPTLDTSPEVLQDEPPNPEPAEVEQLSEWAATVFEILQGCDTPEAVEEAKAEFARSNSRSVSPLVSLDSLCEDRKKEIEREAAA